MEILSDVRRSIGAAGVVVGVVLLPACGIFDVNYEGEGNEFVIRGPIQDIGDNSVQILPIEVLEGNGAAEDWFEPDDPTRVHDNYEGEWCTQQEVGVVLDVQGVEQELDALEEGQWVEIHGRIRESKTSCGKTPTWDDRPVFDTVQEILR